MLAFSLLLLSLQIVVYVASLFPGCHVSALTAFLAMLSGLLAFAMMHFVLEDNPLLRTRAERKGEEGARFASARQAAMWSVLPVWFRRLVVVVGACLALGMVAAFGALRHGGPELRGGTYWVGNSKLGIPYRRSSEAEYWQLQGHQARLVSSVGILVAGLPVIAFIWDRRRGKG